MKNRWFIKASSLALCSSVGWVAQADDRPLSAPGGNRQDVGRSGQHGRIIRRPLRPPKLFIATLPPPLSFDKILL